MQGRIKKRAGGKKAGTPTVPLVRCMPCGLYATVCRARGLKMTVRMFSFTCCATRRHVRRGRMKPRDQASANPVQIMVPMMVLALNDRSMPFPWSYDLHE